VLDDDKKPVVRVVPGRRVTMPTATGSIDVDVPNEALDDFEVLDDIRAAGGDADAVRRSEPAFPTEMMISYAYDTVQRGNPVGFFGMVHVLEGTSTALATRAATSLATALQLPPSAFSYLSSHGALDVQHVDFFRDLVDAFDKPSDRAAVVHASRRFYRLYGDIFSHLHREHHA